MAIRIASRASITDAFKEALIDIYKQRLISFKTQLDEAPASVARRLRADSGLKIGRLVSLINDSHAFDREITKLRSLSYTMFDIVENKGVSFMYGKTKPIAMTDDTDYWNIGEYGVYLPLERLKTARMNQTFEGDWHFIPFSSPRAIVRTPHHVSTAGDGHPFSRPSKTCWGTFGATVPSILEDGDVVELFRTVYLYIERYNPRSPLGSMQEMTWAKRI